MDELFELPRGYYSPITLQEVGREQLKDALVQRLQRETPERLGQAFEDVGHKSGVATVLTLRSDIDEKERIVVPESL